MNDDNNWLFRDCAHAVAATAKCRRSKVGAVIADRDNILLTGCNRILSDGPSCLDGGCPRGLADYDTVPAKTSTESGPGKCIAIHAEAAVIASAAKLGIRLWDTTMYVTKEPCDTCARLIQAAGIRNVVWP